MDYKRRRRQRSPLRTLLLRPLLPSMLRRALLLSILLRPLRPLPSRLPPPLLRPVTLVEPPRRIHCPLLDGMLDTLPSLSSELPESRSRFSWIRESPFPRFPSLSTFDRELTGIGSDSRSGSADLWLPSTDDCQNCGPHQGLSTATSSSLVATGQPFQDSYGQSHVFVCCGRDPREADPLFCRRPSPLQVLAKSRVISSPTTSLLDPSQ